VVHSSHNLCDKAQDTWLSPSLISYTGICSARNRYMNWRDSYIKQNISVLLYITYMGISGLKHYLSWLKFLHFPQPVKKMLKQDTKTFSWIISKIHYP
jgi:nitric oxide synthase oxygenase domain/subunit